MTSILLPQSLSGFDMKTFALLFVVVLLAAGPLYGQQGDGTHESVTSNVFKPAKVDATAERIGELKLPAGFSVNVFARGLKNPRIIAVAPDGTLYISRREQGDVLMLKPAKGDQNADGPPIAVANRPGAHGLAIHGGLLYIATVKEIFTAKIRADGTLEAPKMIIGDLPDLGQHANRTIAFGPDGMLYISNGSTCNACNENNPEAATILRASPDGKSRTIFATGLRNTIGFGWHPATGELWGMDHGIDFLGDDAQLEELNRIEKGKQYGWPHVWGDGQLTPWTTPPGGISKEEWKARSTPMAIGYTAHSAPMQLVFYTGGTFPREYEGDAFVTMRGSWNRNPASGYEIVRVRFAQGQPTGFEPFLHSFLSDGGKTHFARPVGLAVARDGSLLMADDANGVIYRIAHTGATPDARAQPAAKPMREQAEKTEPLPLAKDRVKANTATTLTVQSKTIKDNGDIPEKHSEYYDGVSPALSWSPVEGAKSYALILEDPDATPITPFVHWLAWNIPADSHSLPEGLQEQMRLTEPDGLLQGKTSRGSTGYFGPRPPVGDKPHRYYFQIFALDAMLDLPAGAERDKLLDAMNGHIIAKGLLMGRFQQTIKPPK
jgi:Raf kinase inhibitor-like YbhB/YbcL family protein